MLCSIVAAILTCYILWARVVEVEETFEKEQLSQLVTNPEALTQETQKEEGPMSYMGASARHKWRELMEKREEEEPELGLADFFCKLYEVVTEKNRIETMEDALALSQQLEEKEKEERIQQEQMFKKEDELMAYLSVLLGKKAMKKKEEYSMANTALLLQGEEKAEELGNRFQKWLLDGEALKWLLSREVKSWFTGLSDKEIEALVNDGLGIVEEGAGIEFSELKRKELISYGCEFLNNVAFFQGLSGYWIDYYAVGLMRNVSRLPKELFRALIEDQLDRWEEMIGRSDDDQTVARSS